MNLVDIGLACIMYLFVAFFLIATAIYLLVFAAPFVLAFICYSIFEWCSKGKLEARKGNA